MATEHKKISVKELQTFIEAVEFAADIEDWIPSARQWKRIREMIDSLESETPRTVAAVQQLTVPQQPYRDPNAPLQRAPAGMPAPTQVAPQQPLPPVFANPAAPNVPAKTPDIDTSTGGYKSGFA